MTFRFERDLKKIDVTRLHRSMGFSEAVQNELLVPGGEFLVDQSPPEVDIGDEALRVIHAHPHEGMFEVRGAKAHLRIFLGYSRIRTGYLEYAKQNVQFAMKKGSELLARAAPRIDLSIAGNEVLKLLGKGRAPRSRMELGVMGAMCLLPSFRLDFDGMENYSDAEDFEFDVVDLHADNYVAESSYEARVAQRVMCVVCRPGPAKVGRRTER